MGWIKDKDSDDEAGRTFVTWFGTDEAENRFNQEAAAQEHLIGFVSW